VPTEHESAIGQVKFQQFCRKLGDEIAPQGDAEMGSEIGTPAARMPGASEWGTLVELRWKHSTRAGGVICSRVLVKPDDTDEP
jgi:hypothetical protein